MRYLSYFVCNIHGLPDHGSEGISIEENFNYSGVPGCKSLHDFYLIPLIVTLNLCIV